jgi:hypothetical protein
MKLGNSQKEGMTKRVFLIKSLKRALARAWNHEMRGGGKERTFQTE